MTFYDLVSGIVGEIPSDDPAVLLILTGTLVVVVIFIDWFLSFFRRIW